MFDHEARIETEELKHTWVQIHEIYLEAERCHNHHKDENAWVEVVRQVLRMAGMGRVNAMIEINSV